MKNYNPADHVNYTHLVGELVSKEYRVRPNKSSYFLCSIEVATQYKGKSHNPDRFQVILWDKLADAVNNEQLYIKSDHSAGTIISVEGRLTQRPAKGQICYSVTGNKVKVLEKMPGKEAFLREIEKENGDQ